MADHDGLDDLVDANDLIEVARATRVLVLRLDGIKGQNGVLHRIESASERLEQIDANLAEAVEKVGEVAKINQTIEKIPDDMISAVDTLGFRTAVARVLSDETLRSLTQLQDVSLDRLDDEITRRAMKIAADFAGPLRRAGVYARLKLDVASYRDRAVKAEAALEQFQGLTQKAEDSMLAQIEHIRLESNRPSVIGAVLIFAAGWACALFANEAWAVLTQWVLQQPVPALLRP